MRVLKEPLVHFILIGIAIFGWFFMVAPESERTEPVETIMIDQGDVELLITRFETSWNRRPNERELQALVDGLVREEVLVREARKLGLDRGDQVIRARLAQKMGFLTNAIAASAEPQNDVLNEYLAANPERFSTAPRVAFDQVYLGEAPNPDDVELALNNLRSDNDWRVAGHQSLLPGSLPLSAVKVVDSTFGRGFSAALLKLELDVWSGPVRSGYGQHLVRITEVSPAKLPSLEDIRGTVLQDWRREKGEDLAQAQYETLLDQYHVELPNFVESEK